MNRKLAAASTVTAIALTGGTVALTSTAHATPRQPSAASSIEHFLITYGPHESEVVVAHGAFVGGGVDHGKGMNDVLSLGGGTLTLHHPDAKSSFKQTGSQKNTCYLAFTITGKYTIAKGTGKYKGYTGSGTYKVLAEAIAKRTASGACNQNANPKVEATTITASGPITK